MIILSFEMSKKEENIYNLKDKNYFKQVDNIEVVPYLNNNSDGLQDILNVAEDNTNEIHVQLVSDNDNNIVKIDFEG